MSTAAYRSAHSSRSFNRQHPRKSSITNSILPSMTNNSAKTVRPPIPPIRESLSTNAISPSQTSSPVVSSPSLPVKKFALQNTIEKQPYTFSNPPRELQRQSIQNMKYLRDKRLRQRVSSAPDENSRQNSPRSILNQQKPLSANESATPRLHDDNLIPPLPLNQSIKRDEQQKTSLNALLKEQERSKVPKAVQKRRIILLFRRVPPSSTPPVLSPRQQPNSSPDKQEKISNDVLQQDKKLIDDLHHPTNNQTSSTPDSYPNDPFYGFDQAEIADSKQIAAILANMQSLDEWIPNAANGGTSPRHQHKSFDPKKYEYVANSSFDTATFKLSPRTLKPAEDLAARSRFSQNYRYEMLSSANAQIPPLMASIVAENNSTMGTGSSNDKTYTFRLNPTATMKKHGSLDDLESISSNMDGEQVQLCFDEILRCFYDPYTGNYYEITSA
ncbi:unnamed protein product [Adineta ricciae]|uniref:Uncharacterized protein n=1 Tax=Adineta ricciae TaxID=249248 RepID=A0A815LH12_ADIRI|nr:unnamed protein product [Adineta ricciae]CAF1407044.1 unnamed protein product [Adineta ricciae]